MTKPDYRHAAAAEVAKELDSGPAASMDELREALANAMERIASLESDRDRWEQRIKAFNERVDAVMRQGPGLLREQ